LFLGALKLQVKVDLAIIDEYKPRVLPHSRISREIKLRVCMIIRSWLKEFAWMAQNEVCR